MISSMKQFDPSDSGKKRIMVVVDTCFWIAMAKLDQSSENRIQGMNDERASTTRKTFDFLESLGDSCVIVASQMMKEELKKTKEKVVGGILAMNNTRDSKEVMKTITPKLELLDETFCENVEYLGLNTWKYIKQHPELPLPPDPVTGKENPDRHLFALADVLSASKRRIGDVLVLSCDENHVIPVGKYKNTQTVKPEDFRDVVEWMLFKNGMTLENVIGKPSREEEEPETFER